ncbi:MAG: hypothetical protein KJ850_08610 [Gammaproteobacteria bacterium]|nr:hypothetical protein [Gammaproteobacteria bacterium]MBU1625102.1 hypothetical protein [Gammaproteobacteria bacterium]MBU1981362.1 hypothetical protein [Gammaproteobacteria bacterium]
MLLTFVNEAEMLHAFQMSMFWGALVVVITTVLMTASLEGTKSEIRNSTAVILGCLFYLLFGILTYKEQYGSFTEADVSAQRITLRYAGSHFLPLNIEAGQIEAIEVDHPGKGVAKQCYLSIKLMSGESHRSAPASNVDCEGFRKQIEMLLGR